MKTLVAAVLPAAQFALLHADPVPDALPPLPDPLGVAGPFAGTTPGGLIVAGGAHFPQAMPWEGGKKVWSDRIWRLEKPDGPWSRAGSLPRPLGYGVSISTDDGVWCLGGSDATRHYAECFRLSWKDGALSVLSGPSLPIPLAHASGALVEGRIVIAGGSETPGEQTASTRIFALDPANPHSWSELPPLPGPGRFLAAAAAVGPEFFLLGGATPVPGPDGKAVRRFLKETWVLTAGKWRTGPDLPRPLAAAPTPCPVVDGEIFLCGGDDGSLVGFQPPEKHPGFCKTVFAYRPGDPAWRDAGTLPTAQVTTTCLHWQDGWIVPSGEVRPGVRTPLIRRLRWP